ncbi:MAG TPA: collagen-binding domain-containing protein, partial [archaeon]|nr:collagen-binding domain-containing protein [archaeon]
NYFHATGNTTIGEPNSPSYLTMLLTAASQATIDGSMGGTTEFYGGLYAPNADIDIGGNAEIYGSVIAQEVVTSGTPQIHYDESLGDLMDPIGLYKVKVLSWRELE